MMIRWYSLPFESFIHNKRSASNKESIYDQSKLIHNVIIN